MRPAWKRTAGTFDEIAGRLTEHGMQTGYHNHHTEFTASDSGELPWDIFFGNTVDEVIMQFDTGNAWLGGGEALPFLRKYPPMEAIDICLPGLRRIRTDAGGQG